VREARETHIVILRWVDLLNESLDNLLLIEPLRDEDRAALGF
jgi:hypothetical protein